MNYRKHTDSNNVNKYRISIIGILTLLIFIVTQLTVSASNFDGTLKSVSISDSAGTNQPPVASFTYSQNGDTITFDANGSSDTDGNIVEYKWDFDSTITAVGPTIDYQIGNKTSVNITLTITDNEQGISIFQQVVPNNQIDNNELIVIGNQISGTSVLPGDSPGWAYFYKIDGTLNTTGSLQSITTTLRQQIGTRLARFSLWSHDAATNRPYSFINGTDTGWITYMAETDPTEVTFDVPGKPILSPNQEYWLGFRTLGYAALWGQMTGGVESFKSGFPNEYSWDHFGQFENLPSISAHDPDNKPGKLLITIN